ncbi:hypothetical protein QUF64_08115 [Anaerolineales bacterium HSG6]|nr:hypothetical protein [Anaerolineales bacterium HSG6]MDM8530389.1 hypothetical protein [Anaerolineales bacterium HSG25]
MSRRKVNLVIICEDVQQSSFARRYLIKRGFHNRKIRIIKCPAGAMSGEQFVRRQLISEVKLYRKKSSYGQGGIALVALIDADTKSVQERLEQINSALEQEGVESIKQNERIAIFIPKRNIETWIRFAKNRNNTDENTVYSKLKKPRSCRDEVDLYVNTICKDGIPSDALPSLVHACNELVKIL